MLEIIKEYIKHVIKKFNTVRNIKKKTNIRIKITLQAQKLMYINKKKS